MKDASFFPMERNRYFYGKLLTVRDLEAEQNYMGAKRRLLNRVVSGAGVVCGLGVARSDDTTLLINSGMALDYAGREIVVEELLVRRLEMIEGYETLQGAKDAYLCLRYDETPIEPVNAVGSDTGATSQCNMVREGYRLFFSTEAPEYRGLLEALGKENVKVLYAANGLTLVFYADAAACAGSEFAAGVLVVKGENAPPVRFTLEGESSVVESENGRICLVYSESPEEKRSVFQTVFHLKAQNLSDMVTPLFPNGAELTVEMGGHTYKNILDMETQLTLCADRVNYQALLDRRDDLAKHLGGRELPIYLARLELIEAADRIFLGSVTNLPFGQRLHRDFASQASDANHMEVTTSVEALEFWQKPDVRATYRQDSNALHLAFGIPSPEVYDYSTNHGTVDITMPGGIKVNHRYYSEEIPHGLGPGNVEVRLAVEFLDVDEAHLFGNSEVFRHKSSQVTPPWVETAVVVYPSRGTMRIGVWLHDNIEGNRIRIHYYAQKPERDTRRMLENRQVSVRIIPEVSRLGKREQMRFRAVVQGSEDKNVVWAVKDEGGGAIDQNGIYQAPETADTYEITATSTADGSVSASAYVIVE